MEYTLLHGNTKLQALIHKLAEWFQSQNVQLEILYGPFFFSHCQGSTFQKLCQGPNTFHIYLVVIHRDYIDASKNIIILSCGTSSIYGKLIKVSIKEILVSSFI